MSRLTSDEAWLDEAIELMVRNGLGLKAAASLLGKDLSIGDAQAIERRRAFQAQLWSVANRFHQEIANNPDRTKRALIGFLYKLAKQLADEGAADKAGEILFKVARIEGWVGPDSNVNVFGNLNASDYNEIRKQLTSKLSTPKDTIDA